MVDCFFWYVVESWNNTKILFKWWTNHFMHNAGLLKTSSLNKLSSQSDIYSYRSCVTKLVSGGMVRTNLIAGEGDGAVSNEGWYIDKVLKYPQTYIPDPEGCQWNYRKIEHLIDLLYFPYGLPRSQSQQ